MNWKKETRNLLKTKHYYTIKNILYIIFVSSLSYNLYCGIRFGVMYYQGQKYVKEAFPIKNVTLNEGFTELIKKLNEENIDVNAKSLIFVNFPVPADPEWVFDLDSILKIDSKKKRDAEMVQFDSIANKNSKDVYFVTAYQRTDRVTEELIAKYKARNRHIIFLDGMNQLYSGYINHQKTRSNAFVWPLAFVMDNNGNLISEQNISEWPTDQFLKRFFKNIAEQII